VNDPGENKALPDVSVIVPARDAAATIARTLAALAAQRFDGTFEVIVVDNGSLDETAAIAVAAGIGVVTRPRGHGPAGARNAGVDAAAAPLLAFTDADCEPEPGWLEAGVRALRSADLVQGAVIPPPDTTVGPFDRTLWVAGEGLYETANLFVRREWWERGGGFRELLPHAGASAPFGEDAWFGWRARRAGARSTFAADAIVRHAVFPRGGTGFVAERRRLAYFPALAARVPELRDSRFYGHWFLSRRTAAFDAAVLGVLVASAARRPWVALAAAAPYVTLAARGAAPWGPRLGPRVLAAAFAADLVGAASLARGSLAEGTLVI
jgi:glycosyltransferase involved in cell wall biosynthesis